MFDTDVTGGSYSEHSSVFTVDIFNAWRTLLWAEKLLNQHLQDCKSLKLSAETLMDESENSTMNEFLSGLREGGEVASCANSAEITLFMLLILQQIAEQNLQRKYNLISELTVKHVRNLSQY